jgi:protein-tyrosine-phosphatase
MLILTQRAACSPSFAVCIGKGEPLQRILFLCNLNSIRSPMAEALVNARFKEHALAASCGIWEGGYLDSAMVDVLREIGIDMSGHHPRAFGDLEEGELDRFSHVIALSEESCERVEALAVPVSHLQAEKWALVDPTCDAYSRETRLLAYRALRDELVRRLRGRFEGA